MKEKIYHNDQNTLAKMAPIQCLNKNGKETLVKHTPLADPTTKLECKWARVLESL